MTNFRLFTSLLNHSFYYLGDHYDTCSVCLEDYVEGEKVRELPCGHSKYILAF